MLPLLFMFGWQIFVVKATQKQSAKKKKQLLILNNGCWFFVKEHSSRIPLEMVRKQQKKHLNYKRPSHLWWFKGVVSGKMDRKKKHSFMVRAVILKQKSKLLLNVPNICVSTMPWASENNTRVGASLSSPYITEKTVRSTKNTIVQRSRSNLV